jgi:hypothetical protein
MEKRRRKINDGRIEKEYEKREGEKEREGGEGEDGGREGDAAAGCGS